MKPSKAEIKEFLTRAVGEVIEQKKVEKILASGKQMTVYYGIDPTGSEIHIGHAIPLRKLAKLQEWGHKVILLIGDFTAMIGDPTGRDEARVPLTSEQVLDNAKTYQDQAAKILNFKGKNSVDVKYNSHWLAKLSFGEIIDLSANFTVQQMLERDMFEKRFYGTFSCKECGEMHVAKYHQGQLWCSKLGFTDQNPTYSKDYFGREIIESSKKPISLHEFFYPLMQGYDSVALDVDLELGGSDQLFNMLAGRTLMQKLKGKEKNVMTFQLLVGSDGRKMSKSFNNHIPINAEPADMYGRVMSIKDELIEEYFMLATDVSEKEIKKIMKADNPRDAKMALAREIVTMYHSVKDAQMAEQAFINQFQKGGMPDDIQEYKVGKKKINLVDLLVESGLCSSKSDARRQVQQNAVKLNGEVLNDIESLLSFKKGDILQKGKRGFRKLI